MKIIPKDRDPEVAKVFDYITNRAKTKINYSSFEEGVGKDFDADFMLYEIISLLMSGDSVNLVAAKINNDLMMQGFHFKNDSLISFVEEVKSKCGLEMLGFNIACDNLFGHNSHPDDVLIQMMLFLDN